MAEAALRADSRGAWACAASIATTARSRRIGSTTRMETSIVCRRAAYVMPSVSRAVASCATLLLALAVAACGGSSSTGSGGKQRLSIATGGTGGVFYPYGGGIAKVITEHVPNVEATAEVTAASVDNLKFLKQGTSDIAFTMADTAQDAAMGTDAFTDFGAVPARTLAVLYSSYVHLVTLAGNGITARRRSARARGVDWRGGIRHHGARVSYPARRRPRPLP